MSNEMSSNNFRQSKNNYSGWDVAISDSEKMIQEAKEKIKRLKKSIETFRQLRDCGEPFPGQDFGENEVKS